MHGGNVWQGADPAAWLDYSANIRPGGAPEWVRRAMEGAIDQSAYYPQLSMARAKAALAAYLELPPDCVQPTAGGISAIDLASRLPVDAMVICTPCFGEYAQLCARNGQKIEFVSLLQGEHGFAAPAECLEPVLRGNRCVWLCNPLNPVGMAFSREELTALLALVEERDCWLVVDEAFVDFCPGNTVRDLIPTHPRLLVTGSMTKALGIPGVRLGYLCAAPALLAGLTPQQLSWELNCFAEAVLLELPQHRAELEADARENARRREVFRRALEELGLYVYPSQANFLLVDFQRPVLPVQQALEQHKILVRPCMDFAGLQDGKHLRLAVKDDAANAAFIKTLREVLPCVENH